MTPPPKHLRMTEAELQKSVEQLLTVCGWSWHHETDSRRSKAGFPDLCAFRDRVIFIELKSDKGRVRPAQREWLDGLKAAGAEVHLWRPADWHDGTIRRTLEHRKPWSPAEEIYAQKMSR